MPDGADRLSDLAAAIADGTPIDWVAAEATAATDAERDQIRRMRVVQRVSAAQSGAPLAPSATPAAWGPLRIIEPIGRGRFGDVYRAWDARLDREVALKLLRRPDVTGEGLASTIVAEGRMLAKVRHPNVATVFGADRLDDSVGVWMELIRGRTLEQELTERGPLPADEVAAIGIDVLSALEAVHQAGLLHRDIKAQNVMRDETGRVVLMDFGTGRERDDPATELAGTPLYIAPEVIEGGGAAVASDIYSVGVLLYHLATGGFPIVGRTLGEVRAAHRRHDAAVHQRLIENLSVKLGAIVARALARAPLERFHSAAAMGAALRAQTVEAVRPDEAASVSTRPSRVFVATAAILVGLVALGVIGVLTTRYSWGLSPSAAGPRMLCEQCSGGLAAVDPDGRWVVLYDGDSGDLVLRYPATGSPRRLGVKQGDWSVSSDAAGLSAISSDGQRIAYAWNGGSEIRITGLPVGGAGQKLEVADRATAMWPLAWRPDGGALLAQFGRDDRSVDLGWVSLADGTVSIIGRMGWRFRRPGDRAIVSPDGRFVVYSALAVDPPRPPPYLPAQTDAHLYLMSASGGAVTQLTHGSSINRGPVWTADGRRLIYLSNAAGTTDLWRLDIENGAAANRPVLIKKDVGDIVSLGLDAAGTYYYFLGRSGVIETSIIDLETKKTERFVGSSPAWSPDGRSLAIQRPRPAGVTLFVRDLATGAERSYPHEGFDGWPPIWFPGGRSILKLISEADGPFWSRVEVESGQVQRLIPNRGVPGILTHMNIRTLAPDGHTAYFGAYRPLPPNSGILDRIVAADLTTGAYREVLRLPGSDETLPLAAQHMAIAASPNGRWIALTRYDPSIDKSRLAIVGVDGRGYRELHEPFAGGTLRNKLSWTADSRFIFFPIQQGENAFSITKIAVDGGDPQPIGVVVESLNVFDVDREGKRVAYSTLATVGARSEVWALDLGDPAGTGSP